MIIRVFFLYLLINKEKRERDSWRGVSTTKRLREWEETSHSERRYLYNHHNCREGRNSKNNYLLKSNPQRRCFVMNTEKQDEKSHSHETHSSCMHTKVFLSKTSDSSPSKYSLITNSWLGNHDDLCNCCCLLVSFLSCFSLDCKDEATTLTLALFSLEDETSSSSQAFQMEIETLEEKTGLYQHNFLWVLNVITSWSHFVFFRVQNEKFTFSYLLQYKRTAGHHTHSEKRHSLFPRQKNQLQRRSRLFRTKDPRKCRMFDVWIFSCLKE